MELKSLYCPNCGAAVKPVDGLDTFYCSYCGYQIHMDGMSDEAYKARTKVKQMEHEERMQDKKAAKELKDGEQDYKELKLGLIAMFGCFGLAIILGIILSLM